jgi:hypothetical protein
LIKCYFLVISINVKIIFYYHSININKIIFKNYTNFWVFLNGKILHFCHENYRNQFFVQSIQHGQHSFALNKQSRCFHALGRFHLLISKPLLPPTYFHPLMPTYLLLVICVYLISFACLLTSNNTRIRTRVHSPFASSNQRTCHLCFHVGTKYDLLTFAYLFVCLCCCILCVFWACDPT